jgi:hypothetical protein
VRLVHIQRALVELVDLLDPKCRRIPSRELRRKVSLDGRQEETAAAPVHAAREA